MWPRAVVLALLALACVACVRAQPNVAVSRSPASVNEDSGTPIVYTFTRDSTTGTLDVDFVLNGTAIRDTAYTATVDSTGGVSFGGPFSGTLQFDAGDGTVDLSITPIDRAAVNADETVEVNIVSSAGYLSVPTVFTGTIVDTDTADVTVVVGNTRVLEDATVLLRFTMLGARDIAISVQVTVSGTATYGSGADYTITGFDSFNETSGVGILNFAADSGNTIRDLTIVTVEDAIGELAETIIITVDDLSTKYAPGSPGSATLTIFDTDTPAVSVSVDPASVVEDSGDDITVTFRRASNDTATTQLTSQFSLGGTAVLGTHYTFAPSGLLVGMSTTGELTFDAGDTEIVATITPVDDSVQNADRTIEITITDSMDYVITSAQPTVATIVNDDIEVFVTVDPASVLEDSGNSLVFTFERLGINTAALTVNFDVGGTASLSSDYSQSGATTFSASAGTIVIGAGNDTAQITVTPSSDTNVENDETVVISVTAGTGYEVGNNGTASATGTITNDDQNSVSLAVNPLRVRENSGTPFTYTFTRSGDATTALTVGFSVGGSAGLSGVGGTDYVESGAATFSATAGTIVIPQSLFSATMRLTPVGDSQFEQNETISIQLTPSPQYTIDTPGAFVVTIVNDDSGISTVSLTGTPSGVFENPATPMILTFARTGDTSRTLTVEFAVGGTGRFNVDYTQSGANTFTDTAGTVLFRANDRNVEVELIPIANSDVDDDRTVFVTLLADSAYVLSTTQNAFSGQIFDDDVTTIDNLEPVVTAASGAQFVALKLREDLEFPADRQLIVNLIRVEISNFLSISSTYIDVVDVYLQNAEIRLFSVPNGDSALELAEQLVISVNSHDPFFTGTPLQGATAFVVSQTFGDAPTFNQDFGIDPNVINDLIGTVPAEEDFYLDYYYLLNRDSAALQHAASVCTVVAVVAATCLFMTF